MAESPKRPADLSRADASRVAKPGAPTGDTARAADSVPVAAGPFSVLPMKFGRYRIEKLLGKGAMGAVYLAHDTQLDRPIALKVARVSTAGSARAIQRMEAEAKAAAKIDHPLICQVYDFGEIDGIRFIALQYVEGEDLKSYLNRVGHRRPPGNAIRLVLQVAHALRAAHEQGVIHRDLKPENIMMNLNGDPVIMDFGLARRVTGATNAGLTQGMIVGTAGYMSPEQANGKADGIDHRSDMYALGVILFEMLTGEWPFTGSAMEVMGRKCVLEAPSPLSVNPDLPSQLAQVCHKLIAQKKEDRYSDCSELIAALERVDLHAMQDESLESLNALKGIDLNALQDKSFESHEELPDLPVSNRRKKTRKKDLDDSTSSKKELPSRKSQSGGSTTMAKRWLGLPPVMLWTGIGSLGTCLALLVFILFFQIEPGKPASKSDVYNAVQQFTNACKLSEKNLVDAFDRQIKFVPEQSASKTDEQQTRIENLKTEKTTFQKYGMIPFSPAMRPDAIEYLLALAQAEIPVSKAYDKAIGQLTSAQDNWAVGKMLAEKKKVLAPKVVGKWIVSEEGRVGKFRWTLYSNGANGDGGATWTLNESVLVSKLPSRKARGGVFHDTCVVEENGQKFSSKNQFGTRFSGVRTD